MVVEVIEDRFRPTEFISSLFEGNSVVMDMLIVCHFEGQNFVRGVTSTIRTSEDALKLMRESMPRVYP